MTLPATQNLTIGTSTRETYVGPCAACPFVCMHLAAPCPETVWIVQHGSLGLPCANAGRDVRKVPSMWHKVCSFGAEVINSNLPAFPHNDLPVTAVESSMCQRPSNRACRHRETTWQRTFDWFFFPSLNSSCLFSPAGKMPSHGCFRKGSSREHPSKVVSEPRRGCRASTGAPGSRGA